jgi:hypothetical protein
MGVTVAYARYIVIKINIAATRLIVDEHTFASYELNGLFIK